MARILIAMGESALSKTIKAVTGHMVTHVGIIVTLHGEDYVLEAVDSIRLVPLQWYISNYENSGEPYDGSLYEGTLRVAHPDTFHKYAFQQLGREYDWKDLVEIAYNKSFLSKLFGKAERDEDKQLYCSEFIAECLGIGTEAHLLPQDVAEMCTDWRKIW